MDYREWAFYFQVCQAVVTLGIAIAVWINRRQAATNTEIIQLKAEHEKRLTVIEVRVNGAPTHDDLGKIYSCIRETNDQLNDRLNDVSGQLSELKGEFKGVRTTLNDINNFLRQGANG